jgi:hypothetical protein
VCSDFIALFAYSDSHKIQNNVCGEKANNDPLDEQEGFVFSHPECRVEHGHYTGVSYYKNTGSVPNSKESVAWVE